MPGPDIFWLEQKCEDLPERNEWLATGELSVLDRLIFLKRRTEWRLGRWTAKSAFALAYGLPHRNDVLAGIEIRAAVSGMPEVFIFGDAAPVTISISHRSGAAICAIATNKIKLGCDIEIIEPRTSAFVEDYFTLEEQALVAGALPRDRSLLTTLLWSAKESALKALQLGLRADTRSVAVALADRSQESWSALDVCDGNGGSLNGWWREEDGLIRTVVAKPALNEPIPLKHPEASDSYSSAAD